MHVTARLPRTTGASTDRGGAAGGREEDEGSAHSAGRDAADGGEACLRALWSRVRCEGGDCEFLVAESLGVRVEQSFLFFKLHDGSGALRRSGREASGT